MQKLKNCKKLLIEVNQTCNLNCTYCFYRDYGRVEKYLNMKDIDNLIQNCPNVDEFYLTGGECFLSPIIESIIMKLAEIGKVIVFTNGVILNQYNYNRLKAVVSNVDRFIITFDSFDNESYYCRKKLEETRRTIEKIVDINRNKLEVKVCVNEYNYEKIEKTFQKLISMGVKFLSINFVFDINNSNIKHELKDIEKIKNVFEIIYRYKEYFNMKYINMLYDLYVKNKTKNIFPCTADKEYYFIDSLNNYLICPGNCKKIGHRGNWKNCFSKECVNEWEIMYMR